MPTVIPDTGAEHTKMDREITYPKKNIIDEAICQTLRKKDVYKFDMKNIHNLIVVQTSNKLQEKAASDTNFQVVKSGREFIGYLMILNKICF